MKSKYSAATVNQLAKEILAHKTAYYAGKPIISDAAYDKLEDQLRAFAPEHPALHMVGAESSGQNKKVSHQTPMLSLQKTYVFDDLISWQENKPIVGTWKVDGNSLSLVYEGGKLVLAKTRGNGRVGEDVTSKAKWVSDIVPQLDIGVDIEIRGELYCSEHSFAELVEEMLGRGLERPTNPRNIVAGLLGRKTHEDLACYFNFLAFDVLTEDPDLQFETEMEKFAWLKACGFAIPEPKLIKDQKGLEGYLDSVKKIMEEGEIGLDGAVFSFDRRQLHADLGETSHHPRYKMSFKWQGQTAVAQIESITWATSRLGILTPVAVIDPVNLSGAQITNITLHNAEHVMAYNLKAGDRIEIVRSGEVIPKFLQVVEPSKGNYSWPKNCPSCESDLEFDGVRLKCMNQVNCPAQQIGFILNWIRCVEIEDLSEKRLQSMIDIGLVADLCDLYRLTKDDFLKLPLTKDKMAQKLFDNVQKSKELPLARFLNGMGIEGVGLTSWEKILEHHPALNQVLSLSVEDLVAIDGFAEKSAQQIVEGLQLKAEMIAELLNLGIEPQEIEKSESGSSLLGKSFVITGTLTQPRASVAKMIKEAGGKVGGSVSKNTTALITNDSESTSSKMKKAVELGIPIWSEDQLKQQITKG